MKNKMILAVTASLILSTAAFTPSVAQTTVSPKDTSITFEVRGITCGGDLPIICKNVLAKKGVAAIQPIGKAAAKTKFQVTYNPAIIKYLQIVAAVEDAPSCDYPNEKPYKVKKK